MQGDALEQLRTLPDESIDCVVTSPPYWGLRDYGSEGQLGLEPRFEDYITKLADIFDEVKRVLKSSGTCWVNIGDTYSSTPAGNKGHIENELYKGTPKGNDYRDKLAKASQIKGNQSVQHKCLMQIPSRFAIAMTDRGWILRNEVVWHKPNAMPQSVKDRFSVDFEKLFFFTKNKRYFFEQQFEPVGQFWGTRNRENGKYHNEGTGLQPHSGLEKEYTERNKRSVWTIPTKPFPDAHFAVFPEELIETPILAGCPTAGTVLDPFMGSGTTGLVALRLACNFIGIELNPEYVTMAEKRLKKYQNQLRMAV